MKNDKLDIFRTSMFLVTAMFGVGIISLPKAFLNGGYLLSFLFLGLIGYFTFISFSCLAISAHILGENKREMTYFDVCKNIHPSIGILLEFGVMFGAIMTCNIFLKYITDWIITILLPVVNLHLSRYWVAEIILLLLFVPSLQKDFKRLQFAGYLSIISFISLFFILIYYFIALEKPNIPIKPIGNNIAAGIGPLLFSFSAQMNAINIFNRLKNPTIRRCFYFSGFAIIISGIFNFSVGFLGYFTFRNYSNIDIISLICIADSPGAKMIQQTWDKKLILSKIAVFSFCILLSSGYCIRMNPARRSIMNLLSTIIKKEFTEKTELQLRILFTLLIFAINYIVTVWNIEADVLISMSACTLSPIICFYLPSFAYLKATNYKKSLFKNLVILNIFCGIFIMIFVMYGLIFQRK